MLPCLELTQDAIILIKNLEKLCVTNSWETQQFIKAFSQKNYHAFGIQSLQKTLIGYISCYIVHDEIEIITIIVHPQMRQKGYGKQLLYTALNYSMLQGSTKAYLEVKTTNTPAIMLYKNFGFSKSGLRHAYYSETKENAVIYTRSLLKPLPILSSMEFS